MESMSRKEILEVILADWSPPKPPIEYSPFLEDEEWSDISAEYEISWRKKLKDWVSNADPAWIKMIVELIINPTVSPTYGTRFAEAFNYESFE